MDFKQELVMKQISRSSKSVHRDFDEQFTQHNKYIQPHTFPTSGKTANSLEQMLSSYATCKQNTDDGMISGHFIQRCPWESSTTHFKSTRINLPSPRKLLKQKKPYKKTTTRSIHEDVTQHLRELRMKKAKYYEEYNKLSEIAKDATGVCTNGADLETVLKSEKMGLRSETACNYDSNNEDSYERLERIADVEGIEFAQRLGSSRTINEHDRHFLPTFDNKDDDDDDDEDKNEGERRFASSPLFFMRSEE